MNDWNLAACSPVMSASLCRQRLSSSRVTSWQTTSKWFPHQTLLHCVAATAPPSMVQPQRSPSAVRARHSIDSCWCDWALGMTSCPSAPISVSVDWYRFRLMRVMIPSALWVPHSIARSCTMLARVQIPLCSAVRPCLQMSASLRPAHCSSQWPTAPSVVL